MNANEIRWTGQTNTYRDHTPKREDWEPAEILDDWDLS